MTCQIFCSFVRLGTALVLLLILAPAICTSAKTETNPQLTLVVGSTTLSGGETMQAKLYVQRTEANKNDEYTFELNSSVPSLIRSNPQQLRFGHGQERVDFNITTLSTVLKRNVTVRVLRVDDGSGTVLAETTLEVVPALIKNVNVSPSMIGTHGAMVEVTVQLKAPAPPGGIELYHNQIKVVGGGYKLSYPFQNLKVPEGSEKLSIKVEYDKIILETAGLQTPISQIWSATGNNPHPFNASVTTVEFLISIEPITASNTQPVTNIAHKAKFDVVPLRVVSISVSPEPVPGGTEALGSFTLSASPGPGEKILISLVGGGGAWARPLGSSCQSSGGARGVAEIQLTSGVTSYNFKVCSEPTSTQIQRTSRTVLRSGKTEKPVSIIPN